MPIITKRQQEWLYYYISEKRKLPEVERNITSWWVNLSGRPTNSKCACTTKPRALINIKQKLLELKGKIGKSYTVISQQLIEQPDRKSKLGNIIKQQDLTYIYGTICPKSDTTFLSSAHRTYTGIDYIFGIKQTLVHLRELKSFRVCSLSTKESH